MQSLIYYFVASFALFLNFQGVFLDFTCTNCQRRANWAGNIRGTFTLFTPLSFQFENSLFFFFFIFFKGLLVFCLRRGKLNKTPSTCTRRNSASNMPYQMTDVIRHRHLKGKRKENRYIIRSDIRKTINII